MLLKEDLNHIDKIPAALVTFKMHYTGVIPDALTKKGAF